MIEFILGGARSGKSRLAERLAGESALPVTCIVTATAGDDEMRRRIERHRQERNPDWHVIEEPLELGRTLKSLSGGGHCIVVDCMTLWLSNLLMHEQQGHADRFRQELDMLTKALCNHRGYLILVSNEVGQGIVPLGALNRRFVDEAGWLHQMLARQADRMIFVTAGIPQVLKGEALV